MARQLSTIVEEWPIAGGFTISRGTKTHATVVVAELSDDGAVGRGECVPYPRYGESVEEVVRTIEAMAPDIAAGMDREELTETMPHGAARNALDCALWDIEAKLSGRRAYDLAGMSGLKPLVTAYTLSLDKPDAMGEAARAAAHRPLIKLKLGGGGDDAARIARVREQAPDSRLIIDANEAWEPDDLEDLLAACAAADVELVEQPLPAGADEALAVIERPVPVCADESVHDRASLIDLIGRYDAINIKLDKAGGLTEALELSHAARNQGFRLMVGCMLATSLAMAPAILVAQDAEWVDLDGPLLLSEDRKPGLQVQGSTLYPPGPELWG